MSVHKRKIKKQKATGKVNKLNIKAFSRRAIILFCLLFLFSVSLITFHQWRLIIGLLFLFLPLLFGNPKTRAILKKIRTTKVKNYINRLKSYFSKKWEWLLNFRSSFKLCKTCVMIKAGIIFLVISCFIYALWMLLHYLGILVLFLFILGSLIYLYRRKDESIPYVSSFLRREYFRIKFKITVLNNSCSLAERHIYKRIGKEINILLYQIYFRMLHYGILLFKNSRESFEILREELQEEQGKITHVIFKDGKKIEKIDIEKITERIKGGHVKDVEILERLLQKLFQMHKKMQKRLTLFSLASLTIIIITAVASGLITSFIFPNVFDSRAATYTWEQTDWSGGADGGTSISHPANQTGWTKYSTKDAKIKTSVEGEMSLDSPATASIQTTYGDFNAGSKSTTQVIDQGEGEGKVTLSYWVDHGVDGTNYRKVITVDNSSNASELNNYQILLNLDTSELISAGKMNSDCSDIRITDTDGSTKLNYWLEAGCDTTNTKIWTKIPSIPANSSKSIYVNYGKTSLTSESNGTNTFITFDDFSGDLTQWTIDTPLAASTSISIVNSKMKIHVDKLYLQPQNANWWNTPENAPIAYLAQPAGDWSAEIKLESYTVRWGTHVGMILYTNRDNAIQMGRQQTSDVVNNFQVAKIINNVGTGGIGVYNDNTLPALLRIRKLGTTMYYDVSIDDGVTWQQMVSNTQLTGNNVGVFAKHWCPPGPPCYEAIDAPFDNFHIRSYSTPEPTISVGDEQKYYESSGTFVSSVIDTQGFATWGTMTYNSEVPGNSALSMKIRSCDDLDCSGEIAFEDISDTSASGDDLSSKDGVIDGQRYIQYQASFSNTDVTKTPELFDIAINYEFAASSTSSMYNTSDAYNVLTQISWNEISTLDNNVKFQLRTAPALGSSPGLWTSWMGYDGSSGTFFDHAASGCSKEDSLVTCLIPNEISIGDGNNDQWIQYKVILSTANSSELPVLNDVTLQYVVNAIPEFEAAPTAVQGSGSDVSVSYSIKDSDTTTGSCNNCITPSFQYSADNGSTWSDILTGLSENATTTKTVAQESYTQHNFTWNAKSQIDGVYSENAKIKVIVNDGEPANNIASSTTGIFTLDVKNPTAPSVTIKNGDAYASSTAVVLAVSASDDVMEGLQMMVSNDSQFVGATWEDYALNKAWTLQSGDGAKTVYIKFKDWKENISSAANDTIILDATAPNVPSFITIRDISNYDTNEYRLFIAWEVVSDPGDWQQYNIWRSDNGVDYGMSPFQIITSRTTNYITDTGLSTGLAYYYKITTQDAKNNISLSSSVVNDIPDGQGGTDTTPPTISSVASANILTAQATITWATDELSNSTVGYSTTPGNFTNETGVSSMVTSHSVTLTGLTPNTTYYFKTQSIDPSGNIATSTPSAEGYTFSSNPGPEITSDSVTASSIENTTAIIEWKTDTLSDSFVVYSTNSNLSGSTQKGNSTLTTIHSVQLSGLIQGTKYYYYVKSEDASDNLATDNNGGEYYNFITTQDTAAPNISDVKALSVSDTSAMLTWETSEGANSKIEYGPSSVSYATSTTTSNSLDINHAARISELSAKTTYYYHVISADANGNTSTSTQYNFTTLEKLSEESEVEERESSARNDGETTGKSEISGGGITIIDKTDKAAPIISGISVYSITEQEAKITWRTDENSNSFVEYGESADYKKTIGQYDSVLSHSVSLDNLKSETVYHYKILSADSWGNLGQSKEQTFSTQEKKKELTENEKLFKDIAELTKEENNEEISKEEMFVNAAMAAQKAMNIIRDMSSQVSIQTAEKTFSAQYNDWKEITQIIPPPILSGEPRVITSATTAMIAWRTDKEANSLIAIVPDANFSIAQNTENPYIQVVGNSEEKIKEHVVTIYDLEPDTRYHYQIRSQSEIGPMAKSTDFTFETKKETLEITNYTSQINSMEKAVFKWVTNLETNSMVKYIPYRNNTLMVEEAKMATDDSMSIIHEVAIDDFEAGVVYNIELSGMDLRKQSVAKEIPVFSTSEDDLPPIISQIQTDSALSPGKDTKVQTIISWLTNEPSTSRIYYEKGIAKDQFSQKTPMDNSFVKKHVMILTSFDPGTVYSFRAESIDSGGNVSISKIYTILTPRQKESVFQIILNNMEKTFGWVSAIRD